MNKPLFLPISFREAAELAERVAHIKRAQFEGTATEEMEAELFVIRQRIERLRACALGLLSLSSAKGAQS